MSTHIGKKLLPLNQFWPTPPVEGPSSQPSAPLSNLDVLIALRKGKRSCTDHHISYFIFYDRLNPSFRQFAISLSFVSIPRSYEEVILIPAWKQAMNEEMNALISRGMLELASTPTAVVGCRRVYTLKYCLDGSINRYKVRFVVKGYTNIWYGIFETSLVACPNSI